MQREDIETGLTGEDWEPTEATRYYAQVVLKDERAFAEFAFGATPEAAESALRAKLDAAKAR